MNKKKGFTLIELLAVIIILAIIALIAVPVIIGIIANASKKAFENSAYGIIKAGEIYYADKLLTPEGMTADKEFIFPDNYLGLEIKGEKPKSGNIIVSKDGKVEIGISNGKYCARKKFDASEVKLDENIDNCKANGNIVYTDEKCFTFNNSSNGVRIDAYRCPEIKDVVIPKTYNGKQVLEIYPDVFKGKGLTSVILPEGLKIIGSSSFEKNNLTSIVIPSTVTMIGQSSFRENQITGELIVPDSVEIIKNYAFSANKLTSVKIGNGVKTIEWNSFISNDIKTLTLGNSVEAIDEYSFYYNEIETLVIPKSVKTIGSTAFAVNKISSLTLNEGLTTIGSSAFNSNNLTNITIPSNITTIGDYAFSTNKLTSVKIKGKNSKTDFLSYGYGIWEWDTGYSDSNITWNAS